MFMAKEKEEEEKGKKRKRRRKKEKEGEGRKSRRRGGIGRRGKANKLAFNKLVDKQTLIY